MIERQTLHVPLPAVCPRCGYDSYMGWASDHDDASEAFGFCNCAFCGSYRMSLWTMARIDHGLDATGGAIEDGWLLGPTFRSTYDHLLGQALERLRLGMPKRTWEVAGIDLAKTLMGCIEMGRNPIKRAAFGTFLEAYGLWEQGSRSFFEGVVANWLDRWTMTACAECPILSRAPHVVFLAEPTRADIESFVESTGAVPYWGPGTVAAPPDLGGDHLDCLLFLWTDADIVALLLSGGLSAAQKASFDRQSGAVRLYGRFPHYMDARSTI